MAGTKRQEKPKANERQVAGNHYREGGTTGRCSHCQEEIEHWDLYARQPYLEGQITKYVTRWREKNGMEDLRKAEHYLQKLIELAEAGEA